MRKFNACFFAFVVALSIVISNCKAQQINKPLSAAPVNPSVHPLPAAYGSGIKVNAVRTWQARMPVTDLNSLLNGDYQNVNQSAQYLDGLGRPLQTVSKQATTQLKDIVSPFVYNELGQQPYKYLPYVSTEGNGSFKPDPFNAQQTFMQGIFNDEQVYYLQTEYEASPLSRPKKAMLAGNSWAGSNRGVSQEYLLNNSNDAIRIWNITNNALTYINKDLTTNIPFNPPSAVYNAGELYKNVRIDEAGTAVVEYKDKQGRLILKKVQVDNIPADYSGYTGFLCTYYIYDDLDQVRFVLTPKAVAQLIANNSWDLTADIIDELCYRYEHDDRGRTIAKKVPGSGWEYMVYDLHDRLVFSQNAKLRDKGQWLCTLYDKQNRQVMTGMITGYNGNRATLQQEVTNSTTGGSTAPGLQADLVLPNATQGGPFSGTYQALNSIVLDIDFDTRQGYDFAAEIVPAPAPVPVAEESEVDGITVYKNSIPSGAAFIALTKTYYDNYNWTNKTFAASYNGLLDANGSLHPIAMPTQPYSNVTGWVTGSLVKVITDPDNLAAGNWLASVNFYDERGHIIQVYNETHKGVDILTNQYDFDGHVVCSYLDHTNPAGTPVSLHIKTSLKYHTTGRLLEVWKTINDDDSKKALLFKNEYDELGQVKSRQLGHKKELNGNYTSPVYDPIEVLNYTYNIQGWLTGINKEYVNGNTGANGGPWFGMELNYDRGFQVNQYNGNISGTKWRSKGNGIGRAYGYTYDKSGRLLSADFAQLNNSGYTDQGIINFDMELGNGQDPSLAYDENGNMKALKRWGLKSTNSYLIDDLEYNYHKNGNKLRTVQDKAADANGTVGGAWGLGDFTDNNKTGDDYGYDVDGNMITDLNKKLTGTPAIDQTAGAISYNYLNMPWQIQVENGNKGTITYIYDATGSKLKKITFEKAATITYKNSSYLTDITTTTSYVGDIVYESKLYSTGVLSALNYSDKLLLIAHEGGRIRYIPAGEATTGHFEYDYFVKDQLGNVRMVLTEEQKQDVYPAVTLEGDPDISTDAVYTEKQFYNIDPYFIRDLNNNPVTGLSTYPNNNGNPPYNNNPNSNTETSSTKLYQLNAATNKTGLGITLKVMSGDLINIYGKSYWFNSGGNYSEKFPVPVSGILDAFLATPAMMAKGLSAAGISTTGLTDALEIFRSRTDEAAAPWAYINWIFFDEQYNYAGGGFDRVGNDGIIKDHNNVTIPTIMAPKNGYVFIYCSNESREDVFFDNLQVIHTRGALLEETHYYPFGLTMEGISTRSAGMPDNKMEYNGKEMQAQEFSDGNGLDWYDYGARMYDGQLGRWHAVDPLSEQYITYSPYAFGINNPIRYYDKDGRFLGTLIGTVVGGIVGGVRAAIRHENVWGGIGKGALSGAIAGAVFDLTVATAGSGTLALVAAGSLSGAAGNATDQGLNILDGTQKNFSYTQLGVATALGGGLSYAGSKLAPIIMNSSLGRFLGINAGRVEAQPVQSITQQEFANQTANTTSTATTNTVATTGATSINEGVLQRFAGHAFVDGRHNDLGLPIDEMAAKGYNLIRQNLSSLQAGDNTLLAVINGVQKSFKAFVKDGVVTSINMYPNISNRVTRGTVIDLGNISW